MTPSAVLRVDPLRRLGPVDEGIYGQFIEHVGRAVYGGVFEPGSPLADEAGYRADVLEACRQLAPTVLRWPGGNFASGYHWRDGVGPVASRPSRRDLAWGAIETNRFGTEELLELARRLGAEPYLNLNASTGSIDEALGWLEYCNATEDLPEAALRRAGPHPDPHGVRIWGIGNENYGWWQHGHSSAGAYAEVAREWAKLLRWADPGISLVAVGAPSADWNWTVLKEAGTFVDYLSMHFYWHGTPEDQYHSILAGPAAAEADIVAAHGMALAAQRAGGRARPVRIAVDEWGVWSRTIAGIAGANLAERQREGLSARAGVDTRFEEDYDLKDALAVASWLHVMWRHPEKVGLATQAQMVNVIAPVHAAAGGVLRHSVFWPVAVARANAGAESLDVQVLTDAGVGAGGLPGVPGGSLPALDAGGTIDEAGGQLHLSLVNRLADEELAVQVEGAAGTARRLTLWHADPLAANTMSEPERVAPVEDKVDLAGPLVLPPHSHVTLVAPARA